MGDAFNRWWNGLTERGTRIDSPREIARVAFEEGAKQGETVTETIVLAIQGQIWSDRDTLYANYADVEKKAEELRQLIYKARYAENVLRDKAYFLNQQCPDSDDYFAELGLEGLKAGSLIPEALLPPEKYKNLPHPKKPQSV